MYELLQQAFYWTHMATDVERIVISCKSFAQNSPPYHHKRKLQLSPAVGALIFIPMYMFGSFSNTLQHN